MSDDSPDTARDRDTLPPGSPCPFANTVDDDIDVGAQVVARILDEKLGPILEEIRQERVRFTEALNALLEDNSLKTRLLAALDDVRDRQRVNRIDINRILGHCGMDSHG